MTHSLVLGGGGGGDEEAAVACMEVDAEDQARTIGPSVLNSLPFPIGWQVKTHFACLLRMSRDPSPIVHHFPRTPPHTHIHARQLVCDCLPTSDIRYFGAASCDCKAHTRPCVRRLPIRGPLPADDAATDSSDRTLSALTSLVASCPRVEEVQGVELGPVGAAHLGWAWAAHPASLAQCVVLVCWRVRKWRRALTA